MSTGRTESEVRDTGKFKQKMNGNKNRLLIKRNSNGGRRMVNKDRTKYFKEYNKKYVAEHKEETRERYLKNRIRRLAYQKQYLIDNAEKIKTYYARPEIKQRVKESSAKYDNSTKGKATRKRYQNTPERKLQQREYNLRRGKKNE